MSIILTVKEVEPILKRFKDKKILVLGDVGVDRYTKGSVERISPEAPVPIVFVEEEKHKLGLAANVADNVKVLGGTPLLVGVVGQDRVADDFGGLLKEAGIASDHLVVEKGRRTVLKERILSDRQQLLRVDYESIHPVTEASRKQVIQKLEKALPTLNAIVVEDYHKGLIHPELILEVITLAKRAGKLVLVDPHRNTPIEAYKGVDLLTPNKKEAEKLSGVLISNDHQLQEAGHKILELTGAKYVAITLGRDGMAIFTKGQAEAKKIPTVAREVYDVSGAGDTVVSVLALALASDVSIDQAAMLANIAAGIEVSKVGTATVSPEEILDFLNHL